MFRSIINWLRDRFGYVMLPMTPKQFPADIRESTPTVTTQYTRETQDSHIVHAHAEAPVPAPDPAQGPTDRQKASEARLCLERIERELNTTLSQVKTPRAENVVATYRNEFVYLGAALEKAIDYRLKGRENLSKKERQRLLIAIQERHALMFSSRGMLIPQLKLNQPNREQLRQASYATERWLHEVREVIYDFLQNDSVKLKTNQHRPTSFWNQA